MQKERQASQNLLFQEITQKDGNTCTITPPETLHGQHIEVPGDISSAAFFIVAGLITPDSEITIKNVGINDTRAGILKVCQDMGADITLLNTREEGGEPVADLLVKTSELHGTVVGGSIIPTLIDELPVIAMTDLLLTAAQKSLFLFFMEPKSTVLWITVSP